MNRLGSLALTAASSSLAFTLGRHYKSGSELDQPADWFVHARDNLIQATVQQSIYRLGDPNVALSKPIIFRENYVISYDERTRNPRWVFEKITADDLGGDADRKECDFKSDPEVHDYFRAKNMDFKGSGYDRGHLAAAANHSRCVIQHFKFYFLLNRNKLAKCNERNISTLEYLATASSVES